MTTRSKIKKIILSFIVLTLTAAITYYSDIPEIQSVAASSDINKI